MAAREVAVQIRKALQEIRTTDLSDQRIVHVLSLAEQLADVMQLFFSSIDQTIYSEFRYIADYIAKARDEIAELRPNDLGGARIPGAGAELDAVLRDTEVATDAIMQEAESLMCAEDPTPEEIQDAMTRIIEHCSFQDITGQRVRKVVGTLQHIEERISRFADAMGVKDAALEDNDKDKWSKDNLLNGPQLNGPATSQDKIDELFDGDLDQDDIDSLFN